MLAWELSNSLDTSFCLLAFERACQVRKPQIINTDQGAQYTSLAFCERVTGAGIALSMDGKGRAIDNVFTERFWRTLKYEPGRRSGSVAEKLSGRAGCLSAVRPLHPLVQPGADALRLRGPDPKSGL